MDFKTYLKVELSLADRSIETYLRDVKDFLSGIKKDIQAVKKADILEYKASISALSPSTINKKNSAIKSYFRFLLDTGAIQEDPTSGIKNKKVKKEGRKETVDKDSLADFLSGGTKRDNALITLLYITGIRRQELIDAKLGDLSTEGALWILKIPHGKGGKYREVPIADKRSQAIIQEWLLEREKKLCPSLYIFANQKGEKLNPSTINRIVARRAEECGINATPHTLRHSIATHLIESGIPLNHVQSFLGHSSILTTSVYIHAKTEAMFESISQIQKPL